MGQSKLIFLFFVLLVVACSESPIARFEVNREDSTSGIEEFIHVDLDSITNLPADQLQLVKINGNRKIVIPFQVDEQLRLHWRIDALEHGTLQYALIPASHEVQTAKVQLTNNMGALTISTEGKNLLQYHSETVYPSQGVDTVFKRSGFIHPIWSPGGQVLTRIQPPDHYHHYGIWNPWTHVLFEEDTVDFWNLYKKEGTVRFADFVSQSSGPLFAEFITHHEHVVFKKDSSEVIALNELQTIRVTKPEDDNYYFIDFTFELKCGTTSPFLILEYRYGGFGWRAPEEWNPQNSSVLTSENKTRKDADGSVARWCKVQGKLGKENSGMVILSHPENYNHPEPLRIWPEDSNGGQLFVNVAPTKTKDWLFEPGQTYTLRYRLIIFKGHFTKELAEAGWQQYAHPSQVKIEKP